MTVVCRKNENKSGRTNGNLWCPKEDVRSQEYKTKCEEQVTERVAFKLVTSSTDYVQEYQFILSEEVSRRHGVRDN